MSLIHFPRFRSSRIDAQLRELTIGQAIEIAAFGDNKHEATATKFLSFAIEESTGAEVDPRLWTIQERTAVISHYLAHTSDGDKNFEVVGGIEPGRYLDYLDGDHDYSSESIELGVVGGDTWSISHAVGAHSVIMEDICQNHLDWILADMAVRLNMAGETKPDPLRDAGAYADWLRGRMTVFKAYPESDFGALIIAYQHGLGNLHHLFHLRFDDVGYLVNPKVGAALQAARFLASECVSDLARSLCR